MPADPSETKDQQETTEDAFLGGALTIEQMRRGSRAGVDAVFLAAVCPAGPGETVLELGSGSGVVALAVARRVSGAQVRGLEIDPELVAVARRNAARNRLADHARFDHADVMQSAGALIGPDLKPDSFDHALANPPFLSEGEARLPQDPKLRRAHALAPGDLERWIKCMAVFLRPGGSATVIHRADALPQLLSLFERRFGGTVLYPLFPRAGQPASRILLQGRKGSRAPLTIAPGMVLHGDGRDFTPEAQAVLRTGAGLEVSARK